MRRIIRDIRKRLGNLILPVQKPSPWPNLEGDRDVEWAWMMANLGIGPGRVLDFGCGPHSYLGLAAAFRGYRVTGIDLGPVRWPYVHPALEFVQDDLLTHPFEPASFDLILNCSSIEHVGLVSRYGSDNRPDGDLEAMARLRMLLKPGGLMLMTLPIGRDAVFAPLHRVYGKGRLPLLLEGWLVERKEFLTKDASNRWVPTEEPVALEREGSSSCYGLGLFVLRKG